MNPTISIEGEAFALTISDGKREHTVLIPINEPDKLVAMLQARRAADLRIGTAGSPTQWNIDNERAAINAFCADRRAAALAEIGL